MKKLSFIMIICFAANLSAVEEFRTSPHRIIVANYTNKPALGFISESVITNIITQLQGRPATLVFDTMSGWRVNQVSFPMNVSLEFTPGTHLYLDGVGNTCTFNTNYIIAPHNTYIFQSAGGTYAGALANSYIPPNWGGGSALGHGAIYGELPVWMTNIYRRLDTNYTDDITTTNIAAYVPKGYIKDAWASYASTNQVYINEGEGYCNGKYFLITNKITVSVGNLTFGTNFHYIYIDDSASTYPS